MSWSHLSPGGTIGGPSGTGGNLSSADQPQAVRQATDALERIDANTARQEEAPPRDLATFTEKYRGLITTLGLFTALLAFSTNPLLLDDPLLRLLLPSALLLATLCLWLELFLRIPLDESSQLLGYFAGAAFFAFLLLTHQFLRLSLRAPVLVFGWPLPFFQLAMLVLLVIVIALSTLAVPVWLVVRRWKVPGRGAVLLVMLLVLAVGNSLLSSVPREPFAQLFATPTPQATVGLVPP